MPTVSNFSGLRVVIYTNDHRPAHVHVVGRSCEVVFMLCCPLGPPELRENYGFSAKEVRLIEAHLIENLNSLCQHWSNHHGSY